MSRIVQFLSGVTVAAAASVVVNCDATTCSSCVGSGLALACVNYTAPRTPSCTGCGTLTPLCTSTSVDDCQLCVPGLLGLTDSCITTTATIAPYLSARSSWDAGLNLGLFSSPVSLVKFDSQASVDVPTENAVVVLTGSNTIANLNAGAARTNVIFQLNSSQTVTTWNHRAGSAKVSNDGVELKVGSLAFKGDTFAVFQADAASVSFGSIAFDTTASTTTSGNLRVAGGAAHFGTSASVSANITGNGKIQLSGGVSVDGNIPQAVVVDVSVAGQSAPLVTIEASRTFNVSGDITASSNGVISVNGNFVLGSTSTSVDPKVVLNNGGSLAIHSATQLRAKAVDIYAGATLVIGASANRANVMVEKIAKCAGKVQIKLAVTADAFVTASGGEGAVGFKYSSSNDVNELVKCGVEVVDSTNRVFTLTSKTSASTTVGRRLLASSDGTATWGSDSMTFQMEKPQTNSAFAPVAALPVLAAFVAALLF